MAVVGREAPTVRFLRSSTAGLRGGRIGDVDSAVDDDDDEEEEEEGRKREAEDAEDERFDSFKVLSFIECACGNDISLFEEEDDDKVAEGTFNSPLDPPPTTF